MYRDPHIAIAMLIANIMLIAAMIFMSATAAYLAATAAKEGHLPLSAIYSITVPITLGIAIFMAGYAFQNRPGNKADFQGPQPANKPKTQSKKRTKR